MNACEINLEYRYHTRAVQRKVILSHELFQDLVLFSAMKFSTHTHMHRTLFQAQTNLPGALLKNHRAGKLQVLKSGAAPVLQMDRDMSQKGKGSNFDKLPSVQDMDDIKRSIKITWF